MKHGNKKITRQRATAGILAVLFVMVYLGSVMILLPLKHAYAVTTPTVTDYKASNWTDNSGSSEVTGTLSWNSGDAVVVVGVTENGTRTLGTPTATGLSFSLVTSLNVGDVNQAAVYLWSATAGSTSSGTVTSTAAGGTGGRGIGAYSFSNSDGLGANNTISGSTSKDISLSRTYENSAVVTVLGDWNAVNDTTVNSTPAGGTVRQASYSSGVYTGFVADVGDQGPPGSNNYGITDHTGTVLMSGIAVEVRGSASASSVEQEGFRFRADDGSETTANWLANQDSNINRTVDTNTRLRMLLNATNNPGYGLYQLEYKKSTDSVYMKVPSTFPTSGAVTYGATGAIAASNAATSRNPALPSGVTNQSELWAVVGSKNNATHSSSTTDWTKVNQNNSGASWTVSLWRYTGGDATAASSITVTWTGSVASAAQCWRMQGRTGKSPLGTPSVNTGTTSTHSSTGVTTTSSGSRVMYVDAAAANTALGLPSGWTEDFDSGSSTSATDFVVGGKDVASSGGSSGNISVTGANAAWVQQQIELPAPQHIIMATSTNITASGENTTAQLTAPSGKTTSDFQTGRMQDDENPADQIDFTSGKYTELEWNIIANSDMAVTSDAYQFRVTNGGSALQTYTVTPTLTVVTNTAPSSPSSLVQRRTNDTSISTGGWTNETSIELAATVTDSDGGDTISICAEVDPIATAFTSPAGDGDGCSSAVSSGNTAVVTISGLSNGTEYHWQIKAKDAAGAYSSWVTYGGNTENPPTNPAARDFGVDTSAPTGGTVYDGSSAGSDVAFNDGSLSSLSANWDSFDSSISGLSSYEYAIGTTQGGTNVRNWTSNGTSTSVTATSLTLQTSQMYYFSVRANDSAGNTGTAVNSNGQMISPTLSFSVSPSSVTFANLNAGNSYTDTQNTTLTTSTNAYNGYVVRAFATDLLRTGDNKTLGDFSGGTYASPDSWQGGDTGFGYTSSDTSVQGSNIFQASTCPGGSSLVSPGCYAPFTQTNPGDIVADHTANVTGSAISNEAFTITYRVTATNTQPASKYNTSVVYTITPIY